MYCAIADIIKDLPKVELINLANDENRLESVINLNTDSDVLVVRMNEIISDSDQQIDAYLRNKYVLPLTTTPQRVKKYSKIITIYNLYLRRFPIDTPYKAEYDKIISELKDVQRGNVVLDFPTNDVNADVDSNIYASNKSESDKLFSDDNLKYYM